MGDFFFILKQLRNRDTY